MKNRSNTKITYAQIRITATKPCNYALYSASLIIFFQLCAPLCGFKAYI